ncbi:hypothetical protein [Streptomyces sp. NPDC051310]|uniref:hypothetical protein n=1 Tax=Streptomyces sp. NPDC051310 TaxID=3365649 RepID=UPI0037BAB07C
MAKSENTPETPQGTAVSTEGVPEVESVPEADSTPQTGTESFTADAALVDELTAKLDTATGELEALRASVTELEARAVTAETALERERAARKHGLPDELVGFLRGTTAEELDAEAATLAKYSARSTTGLGTGGLDPTDGGLSNVGALVQRTIQRTRTR